MKILFLNLHFVLPQFKFLLLKQSKNILKALPVPPLCCYKHFTEMNWFVSVRGSLWN